MYAELSKNDADSPILFELINAPFKCVSLRWLSWFTLLSLTSCLIKISEKKRISYSHFPFYSYQLRESEKEVNYIFIRNRSRSNEATFQFDWIKHEISPTKYFQKTILFRVQREIYNVGISFDVTS